eukprot:353880-Chlamydomonas_euryale.AAC.7
MLRVGVGSLDLLELALVDGGGHQKIFRTYPLCAKLARHASAILGHTVLVSSWLMAAGGDAFRALPFRPKRVLLATY